MKYINYAIAIFLFIVTALIIYMIWYYLHGHKLKRKPEEEHADKQEQAAEPAKKDKKQKWGVNKDAYCYPGINDVMGFEFVKVIKVPGELTGIQPVPESEERNKHRSWANSKGIGGLTTESNNINPDEREEDTAYPDMRKPVNTDQGETEINKQDIEKESIETVDVEVKSEDLDMIDLMNKNWGEWQHDRDSGSIPSDEEMDGYIDNSETIIEPPEMSQEQLQTAREIEEMKRRIYEAEENKFEKELQTLMSEEEYNEETQETIDFENQENEYVPEDDDIPTTD